LALRVTNANTAALLAALRARSGFSADAVASGRVAAHLAARARELGLADGESAAAHALADAAEFARIEAHFSPPETWLFRYPESFEFLRAFARARATRGVRALVAGAGGWCEPCSLAAALLDGAGEAGAARVSVEAIDRNGAVFASPPRFRAMELRGGIPSFAASSFFADGDAFRPVERVMRAISTRVATAEARVAEAVRRGERFDAILFRNVAIYLDHAPRGAIFAGLASLLADDGVFCVGHAESSAAAAATGLAPAAAPGAFALTRPAPALHRSERAARSAAQPARAAATAAPMVAERALDAETLARAEIAANPTDPRLHLALARILDAAGDRDGAHAAVGRALYLDRNNEEALMLAASIAEARGSREESQHLRTRALRAHLDRTRAEGGA
jgi:chemotaxis protein methyltransferase CheR